MLYKTNYAREKSQLLFADTDSLTYKIKNENIYNDFYREKHRFDFSGYSCDSPFYNNENKRVIGKMKDKLNGKIINEFGFCPENVKL